ncbi:MAG TPA: hypothetical protein VGU26_07870 [Gaiellaceae bacterium]|jgi:hypothetical protein|nr:hypothetical protein [Gaiellaceae bacterium]
MRAVALVAAVTALVLSPAAGAHGPCGTCLDPLSGPPGTEVTIRNTPAYWVIWNGPGLPQDGALRPRYRPDAPRIELVRCSAAPPNSSPVLLCPARRNVRFIAPDVRRGSYPVVIYDGSENGFHYTWDLFRVTEDAGSFPRMYAVLVTLLAAALTLLVYGARRSISHASPSRR